MSWSLTLTGLREQFALDVRRGNSEERGEYGKSKEGRQRKSGAGREY